MKILNKQKFYTLDNILSHNAQYNILLGMRSNGKSYAVKEHVLKKAYAHKGNFIYMRRYKDYIKGKDVESYFRDMPISKITRNEYEGVTVYRGTIFFHWLFISDYLHIYGDSMDVRRAANEYKLRQGIISKDTFEQEENKLLID